MNCRKMDMIVDDTVCRRKGLSRSRHSVKPGTKPLTDQAVLPRQRDGDAYSQEWRTWGGESDLADVPCPAADEF